MANPLGCFDSSFDVRQRWESKLNSKITFCFLRVKVRIKAMIIFDLTSPLIKIKYTANPIFRAVPDIDRFHESCVREACDKICIKKTDTCHAADRAASVIFCKL